MAKALLFDLDGTLVDTAPDLAAALHRLQAELGQPLTPFEQLRPLVSQGARGMLRGGFGLSPDAPDYAPLAQRFLAHYAQALCVHSVLFPGMEPLLRTLESRGIPWGIVTNKVERLARPLIDALGLTARAACIADERLVLDPGFGFGKTLEHNLALLRHLPETTVDGLPVLAGMSRKTMLGALTGKPVADRLAASVTAHLLAAQRGARILRVHDVATTRDALTVWQAVAA